MTVRKRGGRKRALGTRAPLTIPQAPNQRWSLDFAADVLSDGRRLRILVVVDDFSREYLALVADRSLTGHRVARELDRIAQQRGLPLMIVSDNGTELTSHAILGWQGSAALPGTTLPQANRCTTASSSAHPRALASRLQHPATPHEPQRAHPLHLPHRSAMDHNPNGLRL
jgi:transposase InsO family protein